MLMLLAMVSCNTENLEKTTDTTIETESVTDEGTSADATEATSAETTAADETTADATESDTTATEPEGTTAEDESSEETTAVTTEEETKKPIVDAGLDSGVVRDGTPKKYFTLSFDDGMVSDAKIIEILNKYGMTCATFNVSSGLIPSEIDDSYYLSADQIASLAEAGFDIASHTLGHTNLANLINDKDALKAEIETDINNIAEITRVKPVGMAWTEDDLTNTYNTINAVHKLGLVSYARGYKSSGNFALPKYFLRWMPTCSVTDSDMLELADKFIASECTEDMLFFVWGRSGDFVWGKSGDMKGYYESFEQLIAKISQEDDIVLVNNSEFYQLFKDDIPTWEKSAIAAGADTTVVRDGTPKKYFTLSFDDGITQDLRIIEILKKYNAYCATFNINTGLYGANWAWVGQQFNRPDVPHLRFTEEELKTGIYDGFEVAVHTLNHPSLKVYDTNSTMLKKEVYNDALNIYKITGVMPIGMAWPGGDTEYTRTTIEKVVELTHIRYARGTTRTGDFSLPTEFMQWMPTCSLTDNDCLRLAQKFVDAECTEDMLFYVWCHGYEFDLFDTWERLEKLVQMMAEDDSIVLVTNAEFYQLFKDEIPAIIVAE